MWLWAMGLPACEPEPAPGGGPPTATGPEPAPLLDGTEGPPACETLRVTTELVGAWWPTRAREGDELVVSWVDSPEDFRYRLLRAVLSPEGTLSEPEPLSETTFETDELLPLQGGVFGVRWEGESLGTGRWEMELEVHGLPERAAPLYLGGLYAPVSGLHAAPDRWLLATGEDLFTVDGAGNQLGRLSLPGGPPSAQALAQREAQGEEQIALGWGSQAGVWECSVAVVDLEGQPGELVPLSEPGEVCTDLDVVETPSGWLAALELTTAGGAQIWLRPLGPDGQPADVARPLRAPSDLSLQTPRLAALPSGQVVLSWSEVVPWPGPCAGCVPESEVYVVTLDEGLRPLGAPHRVEHEHPLYTYLGAADPLIRPDGTVALQSHFVQHATNIPASGELDCGP
jgi:hypothetical protein